MKVELYRGKDRNILMTVICPTEQYDYSVEMSPEQALHLSNRLQSFIRAQHDYVELVLDTETQR